MNIDFGSRIRGLRKKQELSLKQLAQLAEISVSLLSEVETGKSKPSIDTLYALAKALGVPIAALLAEPSASAKKLSTAQRTRLETASGAGWTRLTPGPESGIEFLEVDYPAGGASGTEWLSHSGREWLMILEGTFRLEFESESYDLLPGDTLVFDSEGQHRLVNTGDTHGKAIQVLFSVSGGKW